MRKLSPAGRQAIAEISRKHGFCPEATTSMLESVMAGHGTMAQFDHPEFGGPGQWMRGGMIMVSNMYDPSLKNRIDGLCTDLANLLAGESEAAPATAPTAAPAHEVPHAASEQGHSEAWWPRDLGRPSSTGAQNGTRYAYFPDVRRLTIDSGGKVTVYDTQDHEITGFSQQQASGEALVFSSQRGKVPVSGLPVVSTTDERPAAGIREAPPVQARTVSGPRETDVFVALERLAELRAKGILSEEEFSAKKSELLGRI